MKIENQNASEVPIFLKFSINSKKQKTKNKTKNTGNKNEMLTSFSNVF